MFEYHTYPGNGEVVKTIFNMVAMLSGSDTLTGAIQAASLFGFLVMLCVAVYKLDLRDSFFTIISIAVIWLVVMTPKTTVLITESAGSGFSGKQYSVSNVPFGLAALASFTSGFGHDLTRKMEQVSTFPDDLNYSRTGMLFGTRLYEQIKTVRIEDPVLTQDWALFMNQCSFFDIHMYRLYSIDELSKSTDIMATLGKTNQAMFTNVTNVNPTPVIDPITKQPRLYYAKTSTTMSCKNAYTELKTRTDQLMKRVTIPNLSNKIFATMDINPSNGVNVNKTTALVSVSNTSFQYLLNNARFDTMKNIEQAAMTELIRDTSVINAQRNNNIAAVQRAFSQAQARSQYIAAQKNSASMAAWNLPILRSLAEAVLIGLFPLIIVIGLLSGVMALRSIGFYLMALMWVQLWAPVASIINLIMTLYARKLMSAATYNGTITPGSSDSILMAAVDAQAAAGAAMWLIPVISGAIVMGGRSLFNAFTGMTAGAKSAAESAGSQAGAGNITGGNMNYNNASANKFSIDPVYSDPQMMSMRSAVGSQNHNLYTGSSISQIAANTAPIAFNMGTSMAHSFEQSSQQLQERSNMLSQTASNMLTAANTQGYQYLSSIGSNQSAMKSFMNSLSANDRTTYQQGLAVAESIANKLGRTLSENEKHSIAMAFGARVEGGIDLPIFGGGKLHGKGEHQFDTNEQTQISNEISQAANAARTNGYSFSQDFARMAQETSQSQSSDTTAQQVSDSIGSMLTKAQSFQTASAEALRKSESFSSAAKEMRATNGQISVSGEHLVREIQDSLGITDTQMRNDPQARAQVIQEVARAGGNEVARFDAMLQNSHFGSGEQSVNTSAGHGSLSTNFAQNGQNQVQMFNQQGRQDVRQASTHLDNAQHRINVASFDNQRNANSAFTQNNLDINSGQETLNNGVQGLEQVQQQQLNNQGYGEQWRSTIQNLHTATENSAVGQAMEKMLPGSISTWRQITGNQNNITNDVRQQLGSGLNGKRYTGKPKQDNSNPKE